MVHFYYRFSIVLLLQRSHRDRFPALDSNHFSPAGRIIIFIINKPFRLTPNSCYRPQPATKKQSF
jgi:hypothetical protein